MIENVFTCEPINYSYEKVLGTVAFKIDTNKGKSGTRLTEEGIYEALEMLLDKAKEKGGTQVYSVRIEEDPSCSGHLIVYGTVVR